MENPWGERTGTKFKSEEDRLKALDEVFGIKLSSVEREGIEGMVSEIKRQ